MTVSTKQSQYTAFLSFPHTARPCHSRTLLPSPIFTISTAIDKIFTNLQSGSVDRRVRGWRVERCLDSKLVSCHDTCSGVARQVPSVFFFFLPPHFYYHPCLNYSVAAISITAAILYLALPMLTASTFHSKYSTNVPDKKEEAVTQNQVQLVTAKITPLHSPSAFTFFPNHKKT